MATLHIEHAITSYAVWKAAFDRFAPARAQAGVLKYHVYQPVDDPHAVAIDLDFASPEQAAGFLTFLREQVWGTGNAPALAGVPQAVILELVEEG